MLEIDRYLHTRTYVRTYTTFVQYYVVHTSNKITRRFRTILILLSYFIFMNFPIQVIEKYYNIFLASKDMRKLNSFLVHSIPTSSSFIFFYINMCTMYDIIFHYM